MHSTLIRTVIYTILFLTFLLQNFGALADPLPYQSVKILDRQLLVDFDRDGTYSPFIIKGVGYSPTPIGRYSDDWGYPSPSDPRPKNLYNDPAVLNRDFAYLRNMNANVIRFWKGNNTQVTLADVQNPRSIWYRRYADIGRFPNYLTTQTFNLAESYGLKIIAGFEMPWPGSWQCNSGTSVYQQAVNFNDPYLRSDILNRFRNYVMAFKDHPALLFWALGNENNLGFNDQTSQGIAQIKAYYSLLQEMAQEARLIEGTYYHPVAIVNGEIQNIGRSEYGTADTDLSSIDIWGANVYRGNSFGDLFEDFKTRSTKAFWISEFGEDAWQTADVKHPEIGVENQSIQATVGETLWKEIESEYLAKKSIGATIMAYSDEWWKPYAWLCEIDNDPNTTANGPGGCNLTQNHYGFGPQDYSCPQDGTIDWEPPLADHFMNEEWWGIMAIKQDARPGYPDIMTPREIYTTLQKSFFSDDIPPIISLSSPQNNSVISGVSVSILASASDNIEVKEVQFKLDSNDLGPEDVTAPYAMTWDTTTASDGPHTITAVARDGEGNFGTASATITVNNTTPPPAPVLLSATPKDAKVALNWTHPMTTVSYTVKYGTTSGNYPYFINLRNLKTTEILRLINGTTYYFVITAKYNGRTSENSNELSVSLPAPDFVITSLSSPAQTAIGSSFVINNTIKNNSTVSGADFIVAYYLSYDDQITTSDILLGKRTIPALNAGQTDTTAAVVTITNSIAPATYYLGAIADYTKFRPETDESNNSMKGNIVNIVPGGDLVIIDVAGPGNIETGKTAVLTDVIKNPGTASIGASYVGYYLSADPVINKQDIYLGTRYIGALAPGASNSGNTNLIIPTTLLPGTYYFGAIADHSQLQKEADENNNTFSGKSVAVISGADLVITNITGPANAATGQTVALTDTLINQGTAPIGASQVGYYLSGDPQITVYDIPLEARSVTALVAGASSNGTVNFNIPANISAGTYYWGAIADYKRSQPEADKGNNSKNGNSVVITPGADLVITNITGPANAVTGQAVTLTDTLINQGTASVGASQVGYYLSGDPQITINDIRLEARSVPALVAGASSNGTVNFNIPSNISAGTYYWGAIADYKRSYPEADKGNNPKTGNSVVISRGVIN